MGRDLVTRVADRARALAATISGEFADLARVYREWAHWKSGCPSCHEKRERRLMAIFLPWNGSLTCVIECLSCGVTWG